MPDLSDYESVPACAARLGLTRSYVNKLIRDGHVPGVVLLGNRYAVPRSFEYTKRRAGWPKGKPRGKKKT